MAYQPIIPIHIDVKDAVSQLDHLTKLLSEDEIKKATSRAINRTLLHIRASVVKQVPKVYTVKGFQVRDRFEFERSNKNTLVGKLKSVSNRIPASNFQSTLVKGGVSQKITRSKKKGIVSTSSKSRREDSLFIKVYRGGATKQVKSVFMMQKGGGRFLAFRGKYLKQDEYREAEFKGRKVQSLLTQSVWDMAVNDKVQTPTAQDGTDFFAKRFEAEVNNLIRLKPQTP